MTKAKIVITWGAKKSRGTTHIQQKNLPFIFTRNEGNPSESNKRFCTLIKAFLP
jgi:hypothetical protein